LFRQTYARKWVPTNILPKPLGRAARSVGVFPSSNGSIIEASARLERGEERNWGDVKIGTTWGIKLGFRSRITYHQWHRLRKLLSGRLNEVPSVPSLLRVKVLMRGMGFSKGSALNFKLRLRSSYGSQCNAILKTYLTPMTQRLYQLPIQNITRTLQILPSDNLYDHLHYTNNHQRASKSCTERRSPPLPLPCPTPPFSRAGEMHIT